MILAVPCCQHEVNRQIHCKELEPLLRYGVIKERMSALITDAIRAGLLEQQGYDTQILEFIDMEHTPKNLLIRAVKRPDGTGTGRQRMLKKQETLRESGRQEGKGSALREEYTLQHTMELLGVNPTLARLLDRNQV